MGRVVPIIRATRRMSTAAMPVSGAAHSGGKARTWAASSSKPWHHSSTKARS